MYSGFLVRYSQTTDMGPTALKEEFITYNSQEEEHTIPHWAPRGSTRINEEEKAATGQDGPGVFLFVCFWFFFKWPRVFTVVSGGRNRQDRLDKLE